VQIGETSCILELFRGHPEMAGVHLQALTRGKGASLRR
jgi:hypothetical protein